MLLMNMKVMQVQDLVININSVHVYNIGLRLTYLLQYSDIMINLAV